MTYQPPPRRRPLLFRPARWSQGVPIAVLVLAAFLAVPAIYVVRLGLVEVSALLEPGGTDR